MTIKQLQKISHQIAKEKGFWDGEMERHPRYHYYLKQNPRNNSELLMLMVTELAEACEALRHNDWKGVAEELVDTMIRIGDFAEARNIDLTEAIRKKVKYNKKRPYRHGKQF